MRPVTAMRMLADAVEQVKSQGPYWQRSGGRDHIVLISHDEGGCWAPHEVADRAIILSHWGRMDARPHSSSRYMADNWESDWRSPIRGIDGRVWTFGSGSRSMIGIHPCYNPRKDILIPVFANPDRILSSYWLAEPPAGSGGSPALALLDAPRPTLAYFSGNLATNEPIKYSRGVRHRLVATFKGKPGWMLVGGRGNAYARDLSTSQFCIVPPGGDGWSSRVDDAVRHGCIPVILIDNVHLPFESLLDYDAFALRVPESHVEKLDELLRAVPEERKRRMRIAMRAVWTRFAYTRIVLDDDVYLPSRRSDGLQLPRSESVARLRKQIMQRGIADAPDALDTILMALHAKMRSTSHGGACEGLMPPGRPL